MAFAAQPLADGQLPTTQTAIYTVPAATTAYVSFLSLFNRNAATQTVDLFINTSGTPRWWRRVTLAQYEQEDVLVGGKALHLSAADAIEAITTTGTAVDYMITGVVET